MNQTHEAGIGPRYAFTEVIFDGTDAPFEETYAAFKKANPTTRVIAGMPSQRRLLIFFGQEGLRDGDLVNVPEGWRELLGEHLVWYNLDVRLIPMVRH